MSAADYTKSPFIVDQSWKDARADIGGKFSISIDANQNVAIAYTKATPTSPGDFNPLWSTATATYDSDFDFITGSFEDSGTRFFSLTLDRSQIKPGRINCRISESQSKEEFPGTPDDGSWTGRH